MCVTVCVSTQNHRKQKRSSGWRDETVVSLVKSFEDTNDVGMCLLLANVFGIAKKDAEVKHSKQELIICVCCLFVSVLNNLN